MSGHTMHGHHGHGQLDGDMPMPMKMMMPMYFWTGNDVTYLFKSLTSETAGGYALGIIATFLLGFALELISYFRKYVHMKAQLQAIENAVRSA